MGKSLAYKIASTANFIDFKTKRFRKLHVFNTDTTAISIDIAIAKDDYAGTGSITDGIHLVRGLSIPVGVGFYMEDYNFGGINDLDFTSGAADEDYTLLIRCTDAAYLASVYIEY